MTYADSPVIRFRLGDGVEREGFLGVGELKELRRLTGMGPVKLSKVITDDPDPEHIEAVVRLALIGGGADPKEARGVAEYYCRPPRPGETAWVAAFALLQSWWKGIPEGTGKRRADAPADVDFAQWEADAARCGISIEALHAMSVGEWIELRAKFTEDGAPEAPDGDALAALKQAAGLGAGREV